MTYAAGALAILALLALAFTSPRATIIVFALGVLGFLAWWTLTPERKYENQPPPRVMAP